MRRRLVLLLALLLALAPGCKGMGGVAAGLGKVAAGAAKGVAHVAPALIRGVAKAGPALAKGVAKAGPALARGVGHVGSAVARSAPTLLRVHVAIAEATLRPQIYVGVPVEASIAPSYPDPCVVCPFEDDCGACVGYAGYACVASPAGAPGRCESSAPPDAPPAPELEPPPVPESDPPPPPPPAPAVGID
jgi:hypothetical protein